MYVNYGTIDDFLYLTENLSLSLNERVCIARYGHIYRGDKVHVCYLAGTTLVQEDCQVAILVLIMGITAFQKSVIVSVLVPFRLCSILYTTPPGQACSVLWVYWSDHLF